MNPISDYEMKQIREKVKRILDAMMGWVSVADVQLLKVTPEAEQYKVVGKFKDYGGKTRAFSFTLDRSLNAVTVEVEEEPR